MGSRFFATFRQSKGIACLVLLSCLMLSWSVGVSNAQAQAAPTITDIRTTGGASSRTGVGGETRVIVGTGFTSTTAVNFGATAATYVVVNDSRIDVILPAGPSTTPVSVVTSNGTATTTFFFTITAPPPTPPAPTPTAPVTKGGLKVKGPTFAVIEASTADNVFLVTLDCATQNNNSVPPSTDVGVQLTVTAPGVAKPVLNPAFMTFPAGSCGYAQAVDLTYTGDDNLQGPQTISLTAETRTGDPNYTTLAAGPATAQRLDQHGSFVTNIDIPRTSETDQRTGRVSNFKVGLNFVGSAYVDDNGFPVEAGDLQPSGNVAVTVTVRSVAGIEGGQDEAKLYTDTQRIAAPSQVLIFEPSNYTVQQNIYVQGLDDTDQDGDKLYIVNVERIDSGDPEYNRVEPDAPLPTPGNIILNVDDEADDNTANELPGVIISPTSSPGAPITTNESGSTTVFRVRLNSQPSADVRVNFSSNRTDEGTVAPNFLIFTSANWDIAQQVTVTGKDDAVEDGDQDYRIVTSVVSTDIKYGGNPNTLPATPPIDPLDVFIRNLDNELAGFTVNPSVIVLSEGATRTISVRLNRQPAVGAEVVVPLRSADQTVVTVDKSTLTFNSTNWDQQQTVTVRAVDNFIRNGDRNFNIIFDPAISDDAQYDDLNPVDVTGTVLDNEVAGIAVNPETGLTTTEAGGSASFTVRLTSQPTADVTVDVSTSDPTEGVVSPQTLTFTRVNWSTGQSITVTGVDDQLDDGDVPYFVVTEPAVSTDPFYDGFNASDASVTNTDDDSASVTITPTTLSTTEGGAPVTFEVSLNAQPTGNVTIPLTTNQQPGSNEGTLSATSLTFTPTNFNTPQTVTVTPGDDDVVDGTKTYKIITGAIVSSDASFSGVNPDDVTVNNQDNDTASAIVTPTELTTTERGEAQTFTVRLGAQPQADVTILYTSGDTTEGFVATGTQFNNSYTRLIFTANNWNVPQTVRVTPVDDPQRDGNVVYYIYGSTLQSRDGAFSRSIAPNIRVTNVDNDVASIVMAPTSGLKTTETGGTARFAVVLTSQPKANVSVTLTSADPSEGLIMIPQQQVPNASQTLIFNPTAGSAGGWNVPQLVTLRGVNDNLQDGDVPYYINGRASSTDLVYNGIRAVSVLATNLDDGDDTTPPTVTITAPGAAPNNVYRTFTYASGTAADNKGVAKVTVRLYRQAGNGVTAGYLASNGAVSATYNEALHELTASGTTGWVVRLPALTSARYDLRATATDKVGLTSSATRSFVIDQIGPRITLSTPTATSGTFTQATGVVVDQGGSTVASARGILFRYAEGSTPAGYFNGTSFVPEQSTNEITLAENGSFTFAFPTLAAGRYSFQVIATDAVTNTSQTAPVNFTFVPATPTPTPTIPGTTPTPTPGPTPVANTTFDLSRTNYVVSIPYMDGTSKTSTTTVAQAFTVPPVAADGSLNYRLRQFDPVQQQYVELINASQLVRGRGYQLTPIATGTAIKMPTTDPTRKPLTDAIFDITLVRNPSLPISDPLNGQNLIGFPFDPARFRSADWTSATVIANGKTYSSPAAAAADNVMFAELYEYDESSGGYTQVTRLVPFKGYAVRTKVNGAIVRLTGSTSP